MVSTGDRLYINLVLLLPLFGGLGTAASYKVNVSVHVAICREYISGNVRQDLSLIHIYTIRVMSGLIDVYFLTFAPFLNGKCRNPYQYNACKPKKWT